jgi:hypothetical protein
MEFRPRAFRALAASAAAGLVAAGAFAAPAAAQGPRDQNDFNGDGIQDLVSVRHADGALMLHHGTAEGTFAEPFVVYPSGWRGMDVSMAGDLTSDGESDLLALDTATGTMYTYPGLGDGRFGARLNSGGGFDSVDVFASDIDYDGDGRNDLLATRRFDNRLFIHAGNGDGTFDAPVTLAGDFDRVDSIVSAGDVDGDRRDDFIVGVSGYLGLSGHVWRIHWGGSEETDWTQNDLGINNDVLFPYVSQLTFLGDMDGDGDAELAAVEAQTGELYRMTVDDLVGFYVYDRTLIGTGWDAYRVAESWSDRSYDFNSDSTSDLLALTASDELLRYPTTSAGRFGSRVSVGTFTEDINYIESAGDFDGDGDPEYLIRAADGSLYASPAEVYNDELLLGYPVGTGWNSMSAIVSGADFSGDADNDILARQASTGDLWLYPGDGHESGTGPRVLYGTGWNSLSLITAAGDLNHDGFADVLARKADNCLYMYAGRAGGLRNGVQIGCGWDVMNTITAVGDLTGDGHTDWIARHTNGNLYLYKGNGAGSYTASTVIGTGWSGLQLA